MIKKITLVGLFINFNLSLACWDVSVVTISGDSSATISTKINNTVSNTSYSRIQACNPFSFLRVTKADFTPAPRSFESAGCSIAGIATGAYFCDYTKVALAASTIWGGALAAAVCRDKQRMPNNDSIYKILNDPTTDTSAFVKGSFKGLAYGSSLGLCANIVADNNLNISNEKLRFNILCAGGLSLSAISAATAETLSNTEKLVTQAVKDFSDKKTIGIANFELKIDWRTK